MLSAQRCAMRRATGIAAAAQPAAARAPQPVHARRQENRAASNEAELDGHSTERARAELARTYITFAYAEAEAALITAERQCARMRAAQSMRKSGGVVLKARLLLFMHEDGLNGTEAKEKLKRSVELMEYNAELDALSQAVTAAEAEVDWYRQQLDKLTLERRQDRSAARTMYYESIVSRAGAGRTG